MQSCGSVEVSHGKIRVRLDGSLANLRFLTLEDIYNAATEKIKQYDCNTFAEYAQNNYRSEVR